MPQNQLKNKTMTDNKNTNTRKKQVNKKNRKRFIGVDVFRSHFGPVSVRAIYDVYSQKFNVEVYNMKKYSLSQCINALRKLENENYIPPHDKKAF